jgi:hypothetical protein
MTDFGTPPATQKSHQQKIHTFVDAVVFNSTDETYTATGLDVSDYRDFTLLIDLDVANTPTDLQIQVRFSDDDSTYHQLMNGPFGDLRFEDAAGNKNEALVGKCLAPYMDIYCISSGCGATDTFTLTLKAILTK